MTLSARLLDVVDALPLGPGTRVLEIGCGPGAMAREIAARVAPDGFVLAVDRSAAAVAAAERACADEIAAGLLAVRRTTAESLVLPPGEPAYDLAVAVRVGALDGRHPGLEAAALAAIGAAVVPGGVLHLDGGTPLRQVSLPGPTL